MSLAIRPELLAQLSLEEGLKLAAYPDPRSPLFAQCRARRLDPYTQFRKVPGWAAISGQPWTIGNGHAGPDVGPDTKWTKEQATAQLAKDAQAAADDLLAAYPWVEELSEVRQDVLIDMCYNMGISHLKGFVNTLRFIRSGDYARGAQGMRNSVWRRQVGNRALHLAEQMETGKR